MIHQLSLGLTLSLVGTLVAGAIIPQVLNARTDTFPRPVNAFSLTARNNIPTTLRCLGDSCVEVRRQINAAAIKNPSGTPLGKLYTVTTEISGHPYELILSLAGSTTWVADENWQCYSAYTLEKLPHSDCRFGATYHRSSEFQRIANQHFNHTYNDLTFANGPVGTVRVKVAGLNLEPVIGVAINSAWIGYGTFASGMLGLAMNTFPAIYQGSEATLHDSSATHVDHPSFLTTLFTANPNIPKLLCFTFGDSKGAIDTVPDGQLFIGGVPNTSHDGFVKTLIVKSSIGRGFDPTAYNIHVDCISVNGKIPGGTKKPLTYLLEIYQHPLSVPEAVMKAVLAEFDEPDFQPGVGGWIVDCGAKIPSIVVQIAGKKFEIPKKSILNEFVAFSDQSTACIINMIGTKDTLVLGSMFLQSLVTVIDIDAQQVSLANKQ